MLFQGNRAFFLDFEWAGRCRTATSDDSDEGWAVFPNVNSEAFRPYLTGVGKLPEPDKDIYVRHDIDCVVGWLRTHFVASNQKNVVKALQILLVEVADVELEPNEAQAHARIDSLDTQDWLKKVDLEVPVIAPHFGDRQVGMYETKRKSSRATAAEPPTKKAKDANSGPGQGQDLARSSG